MVLYANTFFQIISIFYVTLIGIIFFIKKKVESVENSIFRNLVIVGFISAIFDIATVLLGFANPESTMTLFVAKIYLLTLTAVCVIYTEYAVIITNSNYNNEQKLVRYKENRRYILGVYALISVAIMIAPISVFSNDVNIVYSFGPAVTITYLVCGLSALLWATLLIVRVKYLAPRKTFPIVGAMVFGCFAFLVQLYNPQIMMVTPAICFTIAIMYFSVFTIENPDLEMVEEIKRARNAAIKASNAKTDFLSNMSHELRTPLNAILGFSQSLLEQDLDPEVKEDIEDIVSASDTLLELVNEILDISKIESDKFEIVNVEYGVNKVYNYLVTMTEGRIGSRQLEFIREYDENIPPVLYGDCVRIKQIIVNLLTNSVKYTKEGYVKLIMKYEKIDEDYGNLVVSVSDSGIGIKEEDIQKLFSKFSRLDIEQNVNIEGTGLGLALTKKLVDLMGGEINVESKYGIGSTFTVKIKQKIVHKSLEEVENENPLLTRGKFVGHGEKILVVDDNSVNLKVVNRLLKPYNLEIENAINGKECIDKITSGRNYDMILLDDLMPGMTGIETVKHLKEIKDFHIPIIALTANAISGMKEKYLDAGFDGYLSKPIDKILLEEILVEFLENRNQVRIFPQSIKEEKEISTEVVDKENLEVLEEQEEFQTPIPTVHEEELLDEIEDEVFEEILEEENKETVLEEIESLEENSTDIISNSPQKEVSEKRKYLEENNIDVIKSLETLGNMRTYKEKGKEILEEYESKISDLKKFIELNDMQNYSAVAHSLKNDMELIGMYDLAESMEKHETAGREENLSFVIENIESLIEKVNAKMNILRKFLEK